MQALIHQAEQAGKDEAKLQANRQLAPDGFALPPQRLKGLVNSLSNSQKHTPNGLRKIFVGARTGDPVLTDYLDRWGKTIEKIGTEHYPEQARQKKIYGSIQATVEIDATGKLLSVEINRSSGHAILDDAVKNIVQRAAPFERFPTDISQKADILSVTRTWTFTTKEALEAQARPEAER